MVWVSDLDAHVCVVRVNGDVVGCVAEEGVALLGRASAGGLSRGRFALRFLFVLICMQVCLGVCPVELFGLEWVFVLHFFVVFVEESSPVLFVSVASIKNEGNFWQH